MKEGKTFWGKQPGIFIKCMLAIYVVAFVWCYLLNQFLYTYPIITWFLDNWFLWLFSTWWFLSFVAVGQWPFTFIKGRYTRGFAMIFVSWVIGWINYYLLAKYYDATAILAVVGNLYFFIVFFSFTGENFGWAHLSPAKQYLAVITTNLGLTWLLCNTAIQWIPPWWFCVIQIVLGSQLFAYWCGKMTQPLKNIAAWAIVWIIVALYTLLLSLFGWYNYASPDLVSTFWHLGFFSPEGKILFNAWCSFGGLGLLLPMHNWPFRKIKQPWGGIIASIFTFIVACIVTVVFISIFPTLFPIATFGADRWVLEAQTYAWFPTMLVFFVIYGFGWGLEPYIWKGQKATGEYE